MKSIFAPEASRFASGTSGTSGSMAKSASAHINSETKAEGENKRFTPRQCFVLRILMTVDQQGRYSWSLDLLVTHSWSGCPDPARYAQEIGPDDRLPLPPPPGDVGHETPQAFGALLKVNYLPKKNCWVLMEERHLEGKGGPVSIELRSATRYCKPVNAI